MTDASFTFAMTVIEATIIGIGFIGNILSIIIFSKRAFRSNSISTYCIALAICELGTIVEFIPDVYTLSLNKILYDQTDPICKFYYSANTMLSSIQPWIIVVFSLDKLLTMRVYSPAILKKKWFQWSIVSAIVFISIVLYIYLPIYLRIREVIPGYSICDVTSIGFFNIHVIVFTFETCLVPFLAMIITSILIILLLIKSRNSVAQNGQVSRDRKSRDRKYAISSITFNLSFIALKLPLAIFYINLAYFNLYDPVFFKIVYLLYFLNMSMSFFIHILSNSLFRRQFLVLFRLSKETANMKSRTSLMIRKHPLSFI
jgi:hypothetical protein